LNTRLPGKYSSTIPGKAITRYIVKDKRGRSTPTYNRMIPKQNSIKNIPTGKERILLQRSTGTAMFISSPMKPMANTTCIHWITERKKG